MIIEHPIYYKSITTSSGEVVDVVDRMEYVQGSPEVGRLSINNKIFFQDELFCGPIKEYEGFLYLTIREKRFLYSGFRLCKIDLFGKELIKLELQQEIIVITEIEHGVLFYQSDLLENSPVYQLRIEKNE